MVTPPNCLVARPSINTYIGRIIFPPPNFGHDSPATTSPWSVLWCRTAPNSLRYSRQSAWEIDSAIPSARLSGWPRHLRSTSSIRCFSRGIWSKASIWIFLFMYFLVTLRTSIRTGVHITISNYTIILSFFITRGDFFTRRVSFADRLTEHSQASHYQSEGGERNTGMHTAVPGIMG